MSDTCNWGLGVWNHLQHQPWLGWASLRNLGPDWNLSLLKVTFTSKGAQEGMELPVHCFRSLVWYTDYMWHVGLRSGGMISSPTSILIGFNITQQFRPRLKSQPSEGDIYVQGCPGRYGITCSLIQKCCMVPKHYLTGVVEVWGYGFTHNINLDWIGHYPWFWAQIEFSAFWRSHLRPRVPRKVWNYLLSVPEVLYDTQTMSDTYGWGLEACNHPQHQPWLDWTLPRLLGPVWNLSLLKVTFTSKGAQEGMELPAHCFRSLVWYPNNAWLVWLRSDSMVLPITSILIGSDITQEFGPRLKSQPPKIIFTSNCAQEGMELPAHCSRSVVWYTYNVWHVWLRSWGMHHPQHQPWLDWSLPRILGPNWNLSLLKVIFTSNDAQEGMELPAHCFRSVVWYTANVWHM